VYLFKFEFVGLTAGKNIRNKVLFSFFPWKERTKGTSEKGQRSRKGKSPKKQKSTEMNSLISVLFLLGQGTVGAAVGFI